jgi:hypothetical protein|eukprot:SAG25_NODE_11_length_28117_cov_24.264901_1_plen_55_part_00
MLFDYFQTQCHAYSPVEFATVTRSEEGEVLYHMLDAGEIERLIEQADITEEDTQ